VVSSWGNCTKMRESNFPRHGNNFHIRISCKQSHDEHNFWYKMRFLGRISYIKQDFSQRQSTTWIKFEINLVKSQKRLYLLMYWNFIVAQNTCNVFIIWNVINNEVAARLASIQNLEISQEIHCFHELFLTGSATVVFISRDLIQSCNAIFLASFKKQNWCL